MLGWHRVRSNKSEVKDGNITNQQTLWLKAKGLFNTKKRTECND